MLTDLQNLSFADLHAMYYYQKMKAQMAAENTDLVRGEVVQLFNESVRPLVEEMDRRVEFINPK